MNAIACAALMSLVLVTPAFAEEPRWAANPQDAADEGEVAFIGKGTSTVSADAAKEAAQRDAEQQARRRAEELGRQMQRDLEAAARSVQCSLDPAKLAGEVTARASKRFASLPVEKWSAEQVEEGDAIAITAWVFVQFAAMDLARVVIDAAQVTAACSGDTTPASLRVALLEAAKKHTSALPPQ